MKRKALLPGTFISFLVFIFLCCLEGQQASGNHRATCDPDQGKLIKREFLVEDVRQLAEIIETSHPDPYSAGGGRIKFHYRIHKILNAIPENGMTKDEFIKLIRPFMASIGDQHTSIYTEYELDDSAPGGLPYVFGIVEKSLYVQIPFLKSDQVYYGSILVSVEGIPVSELVRRFKGLEGCENDYFALRRFSRSNLLYKPYLQELIPEWKDTGKITFELKLPSGRSEKVTRTLPIKITAPLRFVDSKIALPKTDKSGFLCDFIDPLNRDEEIAYLRVDHMQGYREAKEMGVADGTKSFTENELLNFPSATESFRSFVREMKRRNTQTLIVDLRRNGGGNYMMAPVLIYFLYGKDVLTSIPKTIAKSGGGFGSRYSPLYFKTRTKMTIKKINEGRTIPLKEGDIDFSRIFGDIDSEGENPVRLKTYRKAATFYREYEKEEFSGFYCPSKVMVLMTPWTSSSGLDMALFLYFSGTKLLGTPSAQSPNSWGNLLEWQLKRTGIKGEVSSSFDIVFGHDPERGRILPVHYPLTYEKLKSFNFDINSEFLLALEL